MVMEILSFCMEKGVTVQTIKDNFCLKDDIQTKVLAFAFGLSAEIERFILSKSIYIFHPFHYIDFLQK